MYVVSSAVVTPTIIIPTALYLVGWIVAVIVAVIVVRRGGGKAERFFLVGFSLMLAGSAIPLIAAAPVPWLIERGASSASIVLMYSVSTYLRGFVGLVGILCLVYAFWIKVKVSYDT